VLLKLRAVLSLILDLYESGEEEAEALRGVGCREMTKTQSVFRYER